MGRSGLRRPVWRRLHQGVRQKVVAVELAAVVRMMPMKVVVEGVGSKSLCYGLRDLRNDPRGAGGLVAHYVTLSTG